MSLKSILCTGQITNRGGLDIIEKGFCYSSTETNPNKSNSDVWTVTNSTTNDSFTGTITGLTELTTYYINAYAINSIGIDYSDLPLSVITKGGFVPPTMTIYVNNNKGLPQNVFEMGTSNNIVVSGETTKNDETIFTNGYLNQTPVPISGNPIKSWVGYNATYTSLNVNYSPRALLQTSWAMVHDVFYNCGNPTYQIKSTSTIDAVFPFLWILKSSIQNTSYFNASISGKNYFFYEASANPDPLLPTNGKKVEKQDDKTFLVTPSSINKYMILGYPAYYGKIQFNPGVGWITPGSNYGIMDVNTGLYGGDYGILTRYNYSYYILQYTFTTFSPTIPIEFKIRFV